jgi:hypothetical protein
MTGDLTAWLRRMTETDLGEWREREAHFLAVREREGDYHYFEALERVAQLEAELAILGEHASNDFEKYPECARCAVEAFPCRTVRHLGSGYRHRPGYREEWKP